MKRSYYILLTGSLLFSTITYGQIGLGDAQANFTTADSMVLVPAEYLAELIRIQEVNELVTAELSVKEVENKKLTEAGLKIYPESTADYLQLDLPYETDFAVTIYNGNNKPVVEVDQVFGSNQLNLQHLSKGLYRLELASNGEIYTKEFEKE